jgi:3'(2'), 5'-bisphosphate nucleotidase
MVDVNRVIAGLGEHMPPVMRWAGAVAKQLRTHDIAVGGKKSGFSNTDALTLADLSLQELIVAALRDSDTSFRQCRIEAEEATGDLARFATDSPFVISIDPIDGTKQYRDRSGDGWSVMLHLRTDRDVLYSLVYIPSAGAEGRWVEATPNRLTVGDDDLSRPARAGLDDLPTVSAEGSAEGAAIYMIGFVGREQESVNAVRTAGIDGVDADDTPGCLYDLMAARRFAGSLIHSPNVYDYPVSMQIARKFGGDSFSVHTGRPVDFTDLWFDERSKMWRLRGIVATATDRELLDKLCRVARDWNPDRYSGKN